LWHAPGVFSTVCTLLVDRLQYGSHQRHGKYSYWGYWLMSLLAAKQAVSETVVCCCGVQVVDRESSKHAFIGIGFR
jgi:hypothetical protein